MSKGEQSPSDKHAPMPFLDRHEWTAVEALRWALGRISRSLDCGDYYAKAEAALRSALSAPSAASSALPADQFARTLKVNSIIQAAWDRDAGKLAMALMSEPATAAEIHGSTEIAEVRDALSSSASSSIDGWWKSVQEVG